MIKSPILFHIISICFFYFYFELSTGQSDQIFSSNAAPHGAYKQILLCATALFYLTHMHAQRHNPPLHTHKNTSTYVHQHIPRYTRPCTQMCTHTHTHSKIHALQHDTQRPWNPWQISCCSYVKWIKLGSSKSSRLACRDNRQTATCSKATNQLCVSVCVCVFGYVCLTIVIWTADDERMEVWPDVWAPLCVHISLKFHLNGFKKWTAPILSVRVF